MKPGMSHESMTMRQAIGTLKDQESLELTRLRDDVVQVTVRRQDGEQITSVAVRLSIPVIDTANIDVLAFEIGKALGTVRSR